MCVWEGGVVLGACSYPILYRASSFSIFVAHAHAQGSSHTHCLVMRTLDTDIKYPICCMFM